MKRYYRIADFDIIIDAKNLDYTLLCNYIPFQVRKEEVSALLFSVCFEELPTIKGELIRSIQFNRLALEIYLNKKEESCEVIAHSEITGKEYKLHARKHWTDIQMNLTFSDQEEYGVFDYFMMLAFIYSSSYCDTVLVHASSIQYGDSGVAFLGQSGIGKSTHSRLWMEHIEGTELLNDDQPAVRIIDGINYLYGTPWSGKTPCYKNKRTQLNTLFFMEQAKDNELIQLSPFEALRLLLSSCSMIQEERDTFNCIVKTLVSIAENIPIYKLKNRPEKEAVELAYNNSLNKNTMYIE